MKEGSRESALLLRQFGEAPVAEDVRNGAVMKVPMSSPDLSDAEREAVAAVLKTRTLSIGPEVEAFEQAIAGLSGRRYGIAVSSGTAALHLCVRAAGIQEGDLVITSPFSFVASANVLLYERAVPVFVDVDPATGNLDPEQVGAASAALTSGEDGWLPRKNVGNGGKLRAILTVDVFGQPADYGRLAPIVETYGLDLIEDSSEALGAHYSGQPAGSFGDAGVFAFYPNKQLTTGEGGMVVTDREDWADWIRALRNHGRAVGDAWLQHTYPGYNYRLDEMSAALGRVQAGRIEELLNKRAQVAEWYGIALANIESLELPALVPTTSSMSWFVYVVRLDPAIDRSEIIKALQQDGIPSRAYFEPIHLQPYMVEIHGYRAGDFPIAEDLGNRSLALPFSGVMTEEQVGLVSEALRNVLAS
ncbi:MAG: DegT/DnrJ/EryC1/StrS family aminotransferase [Anaerolineales bacterium]